MRASENRAAGLWKSNRRAISRDAETGADGGMKAEVNISRQRQTLASVWRDISLLRCRNRAGLAICANRRGVSDQNFNNDEASENRTASKLHGNDEAIEISSSSRSGI